VWGRLGTLEFGLDRRDGPRFDDGGALGAQLRDPLHKPCALIGDPRPQAVTSAMLTEAKPVDANNVTTRTMPHTAQAGAASARRPSVPDRHRGTRQDERQAVGAD